MKGLQRCQKGHFPLFFDPPHPPPHPNVRPKTGGRSFFWFQAKIAKICVLKNSLLTIRVLNNFLVHGFYLPILYHHIQLYLSGKYSIKHCLKTHIWQLIVIFKILHSVNYTTYCLNVRTSIYIVSLVSRVEHKVNVCVYALAMDTTRLMAVMLGENQRYQYMRPW